LQSPLGLVADLRTIPTRHKRARGQSCSFGEWTRLGERAADASACCRNARPAEARRTRDPRQRRRDGEGWYERLLGAEPSVIAHATEAVWELAEHRSPFIEEDAAGAGRAIHTIFVDDLDKRVADIASRGIQADELVTYPGKARKAIYRDSDGNEIGFGGAID
jgi:glyoxalase/bleomycin resistance protein/dioxygenase superfamily protein